MLLASGGGGESFSVFLPKERFYVAPQWQTLCKLEKQRREQCVAHVKPASVPNHLCRGERAGGGAPRLLSRSLRVGEQPHPHQIFFRGKLFITKSCRTNPSFLSHHLYVHSVARRPQALPLQPPPPQAPRPLRPTQGTGGTHPFPVFAIVNHWLCKSKN